MRILMVQAGMVDHLPPLLTAATSMGAAGAHVVVAAGGCSPLPARRLGDQGVRVVTCGDESFPTNRAGKLWFTLRFMALLQRVIRSERPNILWLHSSHAMRYWLWASIFGQAVLVAHAHEIYPRRSLLGKVQSACLSHADLIIVPEVNRAWFTRFTVESRAPIFVIPNRPVEGTSPHEQDSQLAYKLFVEAGGNPDCRRFIIYQGLIAEERCLSQAMRGFQILARPEWGLIIMGGFASRGYRAELQRRVPKGGNAVLLPGMPPPSHLQVTRGCEIGLLLYAPTELNNVYCAPNKIFEYAASGVTMILPDYPGLTALQREFRLGEACDPTSPIQSRLRSQGHRWACTDL